MGRRSQARLRLLDLLPLVAAEGRAKEVSAKGRWFALSWAPSGHLLAVADTGLSLIDAADGSVELIGSLASKSDEQNEAARGERARSLAFSPSEALIAIGAESGNVHIWNVRSRAKRSRYRAHLGNVEQLAFSPDGRLLATAGQDGSIRIRDLATNTSYPRRPVSSPTSALAFSHGGKWIAVGAADGSVTVRDVTELQNEEDNSERQ